MAVAPWDSMQLSRVEEAKIFSEKFSEGIPKLLLQIGYLVETE